MTHGSTGNISIRAGENIRPIVAGTSTGAALDALEELEETAKPFLLLRGVYTRPLTDAQRDAIAP